MTDGRPLGINAIDKARACFPLADVELHDGILVIAPRTDARAIAVTANLVASLLPHIESEDQGFWIEGSARIEFDPRNRRLFALALWTVDPETVPALVIHVMSAHERTRWICGRMNRALELGVKYGLLVDPSTRTFHVLSGVDNAEVITSGNPFPGMLPGWQLDATTLFPQ